MALKRTPLKKGGYTLRKRYLSKRSPESIAKMAEGKEETLEQNVFFLRIWGPLRPSQRVCYETGEILYPDPDGNPSNAYFHHVLSKELYPHFRYSPWNIVLVSLATHNQYETYPQACPKIYALYLLYMSKLSTLEP